jgi:hypothetical protein
VFGLLIINVLFDMWTWAFENRALPVLIQLALLGTTLTVVVLKTGIQWHAEDFLLLALLAYLAVILPFSSDLVLSSNYYLKASLSSLWFLVAHSVLVRPASFDLLLKAIPVIFVLFAGYTTLANIFQWGEIAYSGQNLRLGFIGFESQFQLAIGLVLLPLIVRQYSSKVAKLVVYLLALAIALYLLMVFRRTNLIIIVAGYVGILSFSPNRLSSIRLLAIATLIAFATLPWYWDFISQNLEIRRSRFEDLSYYYLEEGRAVEFQLVAETLSDSFTRLLFGTGELFNEAGRYGFQALDESNYTRQLHTDYARLLFGGGLVAVFLYVAFFAVVLGKFCRAWFKSAPGSSTREYASLGITLTALAIAIGFSSGITYISYRFLLVVLLGALLGLVRQARK